MKRIDDLYRKSTLKIVADLICVYFSFLLALFIRFEFQVPWEQLKRFLAVSPAVALLLVLCNALLGIYKGKWKYASFDEAVHIALSTVVGSTLLFAIALFAYNGRQYVPLSVAIMGGVLSLFALTAVRLQYRFFEEMRLKKPVEGGKRVLLVGAGEAGEVIARDMLRHREYGYTPVAFVDDDPRKRNLIVLGIPVLGNRGDIPRLVKGLGVDDIFITLPEASGKDIRDIVGICERTGAEIKILPGIFRTFSGEVGLSAVRELKLEDLLGREPVETDISSISSYITGKIVMVTGAAGSIGSELCRQLLPLGPAKLLMLDINESGLFDLEMELSHNNSPVKLEALVADIRDAERVNAIFKRYAPQVIFHSAANKHVPIMEAHPSEAVKTNIQGTRNLAVAALLQESELFVLISTDKAVRPANVMGATKRVSEMMVKRLSQNGRTRFCTVRFGNVLGSRGSVVPTFQKQIEMGGPVWVTHPEATRYFMTVEEAVQLVIQAGAYTRGGEIFILDMGEPIKILDLAEKMIGLLARGKKVEIQFTGLRPGEKLHEELVHPVERSQPTPHSKISMVLTQAPSDNGFDEKLEKLIIAAIREEEEDIRTWLKKLVPSYKPADNGSRFAKAPSRDKAEAI